MPTQIIQSARDRLEGKTVRGESLTPRQAEVLTYILQCWLSGFLPSVREIRDHFELQSTNVVAGHIRGLTDKGYIETEPNKGMMLTDKALELAL